MRLAASFWRFPMLPPCWAQCIHCFHLVRFVSISLSICRLVFSDREYDLILKLRSYGFIAPWAHSFPPHLLMKEVDCLMSSYLFNVFGITYVLCFASFRLLRLLRSLRVVSQFVLFACEGEGLINCIIGALRNSFVCSVVSTFACFRSSVTISMKKDHGYDLTFINLLRYRLLPLGLIQCQSGSSDLS